MSKCYGRAGKRLTLRRSHAIGQLVFSESFYLTSRQRLFGHVLFPRAFGAGATVSNRPRSFE